MSDAFPRLRGSDGFAPHNVHADPAGGMRDDELALEFVRAYDALGPAHQAAFCREMLADWTAALHDAHLVQDRCGELAATRVSEELAKVQRAAAQVELVITSIEATLRSWVRLLRWALGDAYDRSPRLRPVVALWLPRRRWWSRPLSSRGPPDEDDEPPEREVIA